jgi:hypothetical protein
LALLVLAPANRENRAARKRMVARLRRYDEATAELGMTDFRQQVVERAQLKITADLEADLIAILES